MCNYLDFYVFSDGTEVEYDDLICPKCGRKPNDMVDECDTLLHCPCGEIFLHNIWDNEDELKKKHPDKYK